MVKEMKQPLSNKKSIAQEYQSFELRSKQEGEKQEGEESMLRRRKQGSGKAQVQKQRTKKQGEAAETYSDPLQWFQPSYATMDSFKTAQDYFKRALEISVQIANLKSRMEIARATYQSILKK